MLWNHRQLQLEIAQQQQRILEQRAAFAAHQGAMQQSLREGVARPRTLGFVFLAGLAYGLIGERRLLPSGFSWLFWQTASSLVLGFLTRSFGAAPTQSEP